MQIHLTYRWCRLPHGQLLFVLCSLSHTPSHWDVCGNSEPPLMRRSSELVSIQVNSSVTKGRKAAAYEQTQGVYGYVQVCQIYRHDHIHLHSKKKQCPSYTTGRSQQTRVDRRGPLDGTMRCDIKKINRIRTNFLLRFLSIFTSWCLGCTGVHRYHFFK